MADLERTSIQKLKDRHAKAMATKLAQAKEAVDKAAELLKLKRNAYYSIAKDLAAMGYDNQGQPLPADAAPPSDPPADPLTPDVGGEG